MTCRRRYAEFERLRASLLAFLPGVGDRLPELPEKKAISLTAAVITERVAGLEAFLQGVLDHPTLSTADELAEFLTWPEDARAPVFARARTSLQSPPPNAQRRAMARAFSLRQAAQRRSSASDASPPAGAEGGGDGSGVGLGRPSMARTSIASGVGTPKTLDKSTASTPSHAQYVEPGYTDALAAAMLRTADDAASVVQRKARDHLRNSRMTEDLDSPAGGARGAGDAPARTDGNVERMAAATERFAARMEAAGVGTAGAGGSSSSAAVGSPSAGDASMLAVLQKLEQMDARLQAMERQQRWGWFDGLLNAVSCGTAKPGGEAW